MSDDRTTKQQRPPRSNRFSAIYVWRGHKKGLMDRDFRAEQPVGVPDPLARTVLYGVPLLLGVVAYWLGAAIAAVDGLLAAAGVLASGLFMAFTQVAAWRDRYTERMVSREASEKPQRFALDETVPHILMATYACFLLLVVVVVGANFADEDGRLVGAFAASTIAICSYVLLMMMIVLPKLYSAYVVTHKVDADISGQSRS